MSAVVASLLDAVRHQQGGRPDLAEEIYRDVILRDPSQTNALYLYGMLQLRDGRASGAVALLDRAARLRGDLGILLHLGRARLAIHDWPGALSVARDVLAKEPHNTEAYYLQGTALNRCGRPIEAIGAFTRALELDPFHAAARLNMGNAYANLDDLAEAERQIRQALIVDPSLIEAHASLGFVLTSQGRLAEGAAACRAAIGLSPDFGAAHWNLAVALLLAGDFDRGFVEYEWRKQHEDFRQFFRDLPGPVWDASPLDGHRLLVCAEQGLGDTIQLARYLPLLAALGAQPVLACDDRLLPLLVFRRGKGTLLAG